MLLAAVIGSGTMAANLMPGDVGLILLANTLATGGALVAIIATLQPLSGAHLNPIVTLVDAALGRRPWLEVPWYVTAQVAGAIAGTALANLMFANPVLFASTHIRTGGAQWLGEVVATFGLVAIIFLAPRRDHFATAATVAGYIAAAYWFTSSTSFANPAVTIARSMSDTFAGVRPADVIGFIIAQLAGGFLGLVLVRWTFFERATA